MKQIPISITSHPQIFAVCLDIMHDNGAINRLEPVPTEILLPWDQPSVSDAYAYLTVAEMMLRRMSAAEREVFAIGEDSESVAVARRYSLTVLYEELNDWFHAGMPCR